MQYKGDSKLMVKKIQVAGDSDEDGVITLTMDENVLKVKTEKALTAKDLFEFFCFERGISYTVERAGMGKVQKGVYEAFYKLIEDIAKDLSAIELKEDENNDVEQDEPLANVNNQNEIDV